jgi:WD40 repeat protein
MQGPPFSLKLLAVIIAWTAFAPAVLGQQQACPAPPPLQVAPGFNLFTPQQEMYLGDAIAEQFQREFGVVKDEALTAHLQEIGDKLLAQLPPSGLQFRFRLVDTPIANAWTIPGGRIYLTRKLVVFANSDDEVAAILAHELGHALTHQPAVEMSEDFRRVLGTKQVGDRDDIFNKWHQYQESRKRVVRSFHKEEANQYVADQVALYALARAGYSPATFADFWDRFAQTQGKTGGWLTDLFGATKPEQRRLREARRSLAAMPEACLKNIHAQAGESFLRWQKSVLEFNGAGRREAIPGLVWKRSLDPPLQSDFTEVKFSPDGRWLLAQDDSSIDVLSRNPLQALFRIDAPDAQKAQFTPDSKSVVFVTRELRVEKWSIAEKKRTEVHEVVLTRDYCIQTRLSPDGESLACFTPQMGVELVDVKSGTVFFQKNEFYQPILADIREWASELSDTGVLEPMFMGFSPDNHYFMVARRKSMLAVDLTTRKAVSLPSRFHDLVGSGFTFSGPDRVIGINLDNPRKSEEVTFPDGHTIATVSLAGHLSPVAHGDYVILRPVDKYPVGVVSVHADKVILASQETALDIYDNVYARGRVDGTVALFDVATHKELAFTKLPASNLGRPRAGAISPDLKWFAASGRSRGGVWDLNNGQRVFHVRGFRGAWFDHDDLLFADFPETETPQKAKRMVDVLDPAHKQALQGWELNIERSTQYGSVVVSLHNQGDEKGTWALYNADLEVKDVGTGKLLWSKHFPRAAPQVNVSAASDRLVAVWPPLSKTGADELAQDPHGQARLAHTDDEAILEVFELRLGKSLGVLPVQMSGTIRHLPIVVTAGDWVVISDSRNRLLVYSISGAQPERRLFGHRPIISADGSLLAVENETGHIEVYDLKTLQKQRELDFPTAVSLLQFTGEAKNLFVLTSDQNAYLVSLGNEVKTQEANKQADMPAQ